MVEITRQNFDEELDDLLDEIRRADFVAIDTNAEVTGFLLSDESVNPDLIKGNEWYRNILIKQKTKSVLDFGITTFTLNRATDLYNWDLTSFHVASYSIPMVLGLAQENDNREKYFLSPQDGEEMLEIDGFGLDFCHETKLDLNKVLYSGTPFMNKERAERAMEYMRLYPDFMTLGKEFSNGDLNVHFFPKVIPKVEEKDIQEIVARLRGVARVFDVIAQTKVPVVGHNLLIKMIFLYKEFVEFLPKEFSKFRNKLVEVVPQFYDTKYVAGVLLEEVKIKKLAEGGENWTELLKDHGLFELYRKLQNVGKDFLEFDLNRETKEVYAEDLEELYDISDGYRLEFSPESYCHISGFDSCLSGIIFVKLAFMSMVGEGRRDFMKDFFNGALACKWKNHFYIPDEIKDSLVKDNESKPTKLMKKLSIK